MLVAIVIVRLVMLRYDYANLDAWDEYVLEGDDVPLDGRTVTARYYGTSTLLFDDGSTKIFIDGFFTRPDSVLDIVLGGDVEPDEQLIERVIAEDMIGRVAAVVVVHSHYDHAMDAPVVAAKTGAMLLGSRSTANVGRGWGLPDDRMRVPTPGTPTRYGDFTITLLESKHVPLPFASDTIGKIITEPLVPPAPATDYYEGGSYSVLIEHPIGTALVQGSAGWKDGELAGKKADVVFLGIGLLGKQPPEYRREYMTQTVAAVDADLVIPIHYDDFTHPFGELVPMPALGDDVETGMRAVYDWTRENGVEFALMPYREKTVIFHTAPEE